jgi:hypothetical protein
MIREMPQKFRGDEKRRFERVDIDPTAQVLVLDAKGRTVGVLRQLARGGFAIEGEKVYRNDDTRVYEFSIHEPEEDIRAEVKARVRFADEQLVGFEFVDLNAAAAVEIGIIIGKYYEHNKR